MVSKGSFLACHVFGVDDAVIGAAVAAAAAAASAAQQQAAQARQRRAAAQAAQQEKQGMPASGQPAGSVSEAALGQLSQGLSANQGRIQDMFSEQKPVADATQGVDLQSAAPSYMDILKRQQMGQVPLGEV